MEVSFRLEEEEEEEEEGEGDEEDASPVRRLERNRAWARLLPP
jgi:hypothetical protein